MSPKSRNGLCVLLSASYWSAGAGPAVGGVLEGAEKSRTFYPPPHATSLACCAGIMSCRHLQDIHVEAYLLRREFDLEPLSGALSSRAEFILLPGHLQCSGKYSVAYTIT